MTAGVIPLSAGEDLRLTKRIVTELRQMAHDADPELAALAREGLGSVAKLVPAAVSDLCVRCQSAGQCRYPGSCG